MLKHSLLILTSAILMACSQEPEPGPQPAASSEGTQTRTVESIPEPRPVTSGNETLQRLAGDPAALRDAMRDPEQREALMEAMRERREARRAEREAEGEGGDGTAVREQMRERRAQMMAERGTDGDSLRVQTRERMLERSRWWADEDLQDSIGLADAQAEALTQAQLQFEEQRESFRQQLGNQQRSLMASVRDGDRSGILEVIEQRAMTQQSLQELELNWWRSMLNELSDEQLAALAEQNPRALMRPGAR